MTDDPWYSPTHQQRDGIPRRRAAGEEVWQLRHSDGRVQSCELRDDSKRGAGWDVLLLMDGEPIISRRCVDERGARFVAESLRQDNVRGGWTDDK